MKVYNTIKGVQSNLRCVVVIELEQDEGTKLNDLLESVVEENEKGNFYYELSREIVKELD